MPTNCYRSLCFFELLDCKYPKIVAYRKMYTRDGILLYTRCDHVLATQQHKLVRGIILLSILYICIGVGFNCSKFNTTDTLSYYRRPNEEYSLGLTTMVYLLTTENLHSIIGKLGHEKESAFPKETLSKPWLLPSFPTLVRTIRTTITGPLLGGEVLDDCIPQRSGRGGILSGYESTFTQRLYYIYYADRNRRTWH